MSFLLKSKHKIGRLFPAKIVEAIRVKSGKSLNANPSIAIVLKDTDEPNLKKIKKYVQHLKGEYGIRNIMIMAYSECFTEHTPIYLGHYKELDYFTQEDLNWRLKPVQVLAEFCKKDFDILIDLTSEECLPLEHVIAGSKAKMKVGRSKAIHERYYDLIVELDSSKPLLDFLKETEYLLAKFSFI